MMATRPLSGEEYYHFRHLKNVFLLVMSAASEEPRVKKLLVQHIETVHHSEAVEDVLHSLLVIL